ncbi:hypothetical protein [Chryseobacterium balustinum]|uniref:hypothetical protein n=1 Tax=Chryseobacterium balustinum TaxID=246 RepID=UPI003CF2E3F8
MTQQDTFILLYDAAEEFAGEPDLLFENAIGLLQYAAVQKNIEFDGYFRTKWEIEAEHPMTFDDEYFENENRSELYVYLAAEANQEIYECLEYAWNVTHEEKLTENILHREIYLLKEKGVSF